VLEARATCAGSFHFQAVGQVVILWHQYHAPSLLTILSVEKLIWILRRKKARI
jgi:hypothetical protein